MVHIFLSRFTLNIMISECVLCFASLKLVTPNAETMSNKGLSVWCNFKIEQNRAHTRETIFSANEQHHENEQDSFHPKC